MNKYELISVIDTAMEESARNELIARFNGMIEENAGKVEKVEEWGKRRLAYTVNYKHEGYYVLVNFTANPELPLEIERVMQINESILRYLTVKVEEKRSNVKPRPVRVAPAAEEAPAAEAAAPAVAE